MPQPKPGAKDSRYPSSNATRPRHSLAAMPSAFALALVFSLSALFLTACGSATGGMTLISAPELPPVDDLVPSGGNSSVSVSSPNLADGTTATTVTITLRSLRNLPIPSVVPILSLSGSGNTINTCSPTDSNGVSICRIYSVRAETKTLSVSAGRASLSVDVTFTLPAQSKQAFGVASGGGQMLGTGVRVVSSAGVVPDTIVLKDSTNKKRGQSSFQGAIQ